MTRLSKIETLNSQSDARAHAAESGSDTPSNAAALTFRVHGSQYNGRVVRLASRSCTVGSHASCTLRVVSDDVPPMQCLILRGDKGTAVRRWSPRVHLNGAEFTDEWLTQGDRLDLGPIELEFLGQVDATPPKPGGSQRPQPDSTASLFTDSAHSETRQLHKARVQRLCRALREANEQIVLRREEIERQQERLDELVSRIAQFEADHEQARRRFEEQLKSQRVELNEKQQQLEEGQRDLSEREAQLEQSQIDLQARWNDLERERAKTLAESHASASDQANDGSKIDADELRKQQEQFEHGREQLRAEREQLGAREQELDKATRDFEEERQAFDDEREQWDNVRAELEARLIKQIQSLNEAPFTELDELEEEYEYVDEPYDELDDQYDEEYEYEDDPEIDQDTNQDVVSENDDANADSDRGAIRQPEISFSKPDVSSPVSTASILGQFQQANQEDAGAGESSADSSGDDQASIDDYMNRLLNRMGVESKGVSPQLDSGLHHDEPNQPKRVPNITGPDHGGLDHGGSDHGGSAASRAIDIEPHTERRPKVTRSLSPGVPPPELDLELMRDIANETARSAINRHSQKVWIQAAFTKWCVAFLSLATSAVLLYWTSRLFSFFGVAAIVALCVSVFWLIQGIWLTRSALKTRSRRKRRLKSSRLRAVAMQASPSAEENGGSSTTLPAESVADSPAESSASLAEEPSTGGAATEDATAAARDVAPVATECNERADAEVDPNVVLRGQVSEPQDLATEDSVIEDPATDDPATDDPATDDPATDDSNKNASES